MDKVSSAKGVSPYAKGVTLPPQKKLKFGNRAYFLNWVYIRWTATFSDHYLSTPIEFTRPNPVDCSHHQHALKIRYTMFSCKSVSSFVRNLKKKSPPQTGNIRIRGVWRVQLDEKRAVPTRGRSSRLARDTNIAHHHNPEVLLRLQTETFNGGNFVEEEHLFFSTNKNPQPRVDVVVFENLERHFYYNGDR